MESLVIECLRCGTTRETASLSPRPNEPSECPRCGYLGWAPVDALSEHDRRALRERPLERRRLRLA